MLQRHSLALILLLCVLLLFSGCTPVASTSQTSHTSPSSQTNQQTSTSSVSPSSSAISDSVNLMAHIQAPSWPQSPQSPDPDYVEAVNRFSARLLNKSLTNEGNILVSPASVFLALSMTMNGADGDTKAAMLNVLANQGITAEMLNTFSRDWIAMLTETGSKTSLKVANSIWFSKNFQPYQPFLQTNADFYNAGARKLDFSDIKAKGIINSWVSVQTDGLIDSIIEKIDPSTVMFLINTIYFQAAWQSPFIPERTQKEIFHAPTGDVEIEFMNHVGKMNYFKGEEITGVSLPYDDGQFAYFAILPEGTDTPRDWLIKQGEGTLFETISQMMAQKSNYTVALSLPKYKSAYADSLVDELTAIGMGIAFDPTRADFSMLDEQHSKDLYISEVKHKTYISVEEKGTEAAAATVVVIDKGMPAADIQLTFNRPFVYGIMDMETGIPLFVGLLEDPEL